MFDVHGTCPCGNVRVEAHLSRMPSEYNPRVCDCDFCRRLKTSYVSDPRGSLSFEIRSMELLKKERQGSETADFLTCRGCGSLVGVIYHDGARVYGAPNAGLLNGPFGEPVVVSPKSLTSAEKIARWKDVWFAKVTLRGPEPLS